MRMLLPGVRLRRHVQQNLSAFFTENRDSDFRAALSLLVGFYRVPSPKIVWFEYMGGGLTLGEVCADGRIHLVHPENWQKRRNGNSESEWIRTVLHEWAHYLFFVNDEEKADLFAGRFVRGL